MENEKRRRSKPYNDFHRVDKHGGLGGVRSRTHALAGNYRKCLHRVYESYAHLFQVHIQGIGALHDGPTTPQVQASSTSSLLPIIAVNSNTNEVAWQ